MSIHEIYHQTIQGLPASDRLRLARLILDGIPPEAIVDYRTTWDDEDIRDFGRAGWVHIETALAETPDA